MKVLSCDFHIMHYIQSDMFEFCVGVVFMARRPNKLVNNRVHCILYCLSCINLLLLYSSSSLSTDVFSSS